MHFFINYKGRCYPIKFSFEPEDKAEAISIIIKKLFPEVNEQYELQYNCTAIDQTKKISELSLEDGSTICIVPITKKLHIKSRVTNDVNVYNRLDVDYDPNDTVSLLIAKYSDFFSNQLYCVSYLGNEIDDNKTFQSLGILADSTLYFTTLLSTTSTVTFVFTEEAPLIQPIDLSISVLKAKQIIQNDLLQRSKKLISYAKMNLYRNAVQLNEELSLFENGVSCNTVITVQINGEDIHQTKETIGKQ
ncbi:hypothetical protein WA158_000177 [Blastocystis sp. Blastoise]